MFDELLNIKLLIDDIVDALKGNIFKEYIFDPFTGTKTFEYLNNGINYSVNDIIKKFR
jgi:hypothetical protein